MVGVAGPPQYQEAGALASTSPRMRWRNSVAMPPTTSGPNVCSVSAGSPSFVRPLAESATCNARSSGRTEPGVTRSASPPSQPRRSRRLPDLQQQEAGRLEAAVAASH